MSEHQPPGRVEESPPQFSTRTLLIGITACAVVILVLRHLSVLWGATLVWFLVMAAAHVAANMRGAHRRSTDCDDRALDELPAHTRPTRISYAPATRLRHNKGFSRLLLLVTASCALLGLLGGTVALLLTTRASAGGIALGGISAAVLGGFLGFVAGSFTMVATGAFQEAARGTPTPARGAGEA